MIKNRNKAKEKWHKIVEMFHLFNEGISKTKNTSLASAIVSPQGQSTKSLARVPFERNAAKSQSKFLRSNSKPTRILK